MESAFDIDLSGDEDLPPGVQPGSLSGSDDPPEDATPVDPSAEEVEEARSAADLDADFEAALGGDDVETVEAEPVERELETGAGQENPLGDASPPEADAETADDDGPPEVPASESAPAGQGSDSPPAPEPAPTPAPKRAARKKAAKRPAAQPPTPVASGPASRLYFIFQRHEAEVGGHMQTVYAKVLFADPDNPQGDPLQGIRARNRDMALYKAGKLFGHGFEGRLVATPEGMWEEKDVRNKPREEFRVEVG